MFITWVSATCFGAYGHLQVDELTKTHKRLYLACVFYTVEGGGRGYWMGVRDLVCIMSMCVMSIKRRMRNITAYVFLSIHQPEDGHKHRNM